jgi:hypothetical protein
MGGFLHNGETVSLLSSNVLYKVEDLSRIFRIFVKDWFLITIFH